jgi:diketogulonate reductase-like aldo/keto reductase
MVCATNLSKSMKYPSIGLGTWRAVSPGEAARSVTAALANGLRLIDCAHVYSNEAEVGAALQPFLKEHGRDSVFVTSKLFNHHHRPELVRKACETSLRNLQLSHLDLYMMHWPVAFKYVDEATLYPKDAAGNAITEDVSLLSTWRAMEALVRDGLVKEIGVCNFGCKQLSALFEAAEIRPTHLQVEAHPYHPNDDLLALAKSHNMTFTAYSPLGNPSFAREGLPVLLEDETVVRIAKERGVSSAAVLLRWAVQRGTTPIFKSGKEERIRDNFAGCQSITLSERDMADIGAIKTRARYVSPPWQTWE